MSTEKPSAITDEEVAASLGAACMFVTRESIKDMRRALETFVAGRATSLCAPSVEPDDWMRACRCAVSHLDYESGAPEQVKDALRGLRDAYLNATAASPSAPQPAEGVIPTQRVESSPVSPEEEERMLEHAVRAAIQQFGPERFARALSAAPQPVAVEPPKRPNGVDIALNMMREAKGGQEVKLWTPMCWDFARYVAQLESAASSPQEKDRVEVSHCSGCGLPGPNPCGQLGCPTGVKVEGGSDA
jgi:hypothetical protein